MDGPASAGLCEVLEAGEGRDSLTAALTDHGRQVGERRDVGQLVERQEDLTAVEGAGRTGDVGIGRVADVLDEADHHGCYERLPVGRGRDVDGVGRAHELSRVEGGVTGGLECLVASESRSVLRRRWTRSRSALARRWR